MSAPDTPPSQPSPAARKAPPRWIAYLVAGFVAYGVAGIVAAPIYWHHLERAYAPITPNTPTNQIAAIYFKQRWQPERVLYVTPTQAAIYWMLYFPPFVVGGVLVVGGIVAIARKARARNLEQL